MISRQACVDDFDAISKLLAGVDLPTADLLPSVGMFFVAEMKGQIVGTAGVERYGAVGLLRSGATSPHMRDKGVAVGLCAEAIHSARELGVRDMHLLTCPSPKSHPPRFKAKPVAPVAIVEVPSHLARMLLLFKLLVWAVRALARSRQGLVLDNLALRHQLASVAPRGRRPRLLPRDRLFWVALRAVWTDWARSLAIVKPATVVGWHRRAYRAYWRRLSRKPGRPRTNAQLRDLIRRMVTENRCTTVTSGGWPRETGSGWNFREGQGTAVGSLAHRELVAQCEHFELQRRAGADDGGETLQDSNHHGSHGRLPYRGHPAHAMPANRCDGCCTINPPDDSEYSGWPRAQSGGTGRTRGWLTERSACAPRGRSERL